ncbi:unnamed protein product [Cylindrotheca closterium]|uniref:rRNA methyltransferase 1, mitochondrial n=1 Tax=Cylindrotheca closterium TaxID=2856 RepID=A0AAD2JH13_9STRA|nr:unnamed protein product [Cylindrotheca closterium]
MKSLVIMGFIALLSRTARIRLTANAFQLNTARATTVASQQGRRQMSSYDDDQGRRIRGQPAEKDAWDDDGDSWGEPSRERAGGDSWGAPGRDRGGDRGRGGDRPRDDDGWGSSANVKEDIGGGGWDDFDVDSYTSSAPRRSNSAPRRRTDSRGGRGRGGRGGSDGWRGRGGDRRGGRGDSDEFRGRGDRRGGRGDSDGYRGRGGRGDRQSNDRDTRQRFGLNNPREQKKERAINMNGLETAGFVHLYGLSSVLNALKAERRDLTTSQEKSELWTGEEEEDVEIENRTPPPPQAQFRPYLFVQDKEFTQRRGSKAEQEKQALELAEVHGIPVARVDKGILNTLSGNRPHQGMVLRCGKLFFESQSRINPPRDSTEPKLWLVLDEVVDPQNLGALIRSAYFLGGQQKLGVMVCSKNSAPPTPVVSAASAGALEVQTIYSTNNLPRTLQHAAEDGFRIIGASSSVPSTRDENPPPMYDLQALPAIGGEDDRPAILVLGSEGYGLRTMVAKACTEFVRIPSGVSTSADDEMEDSEKDVDSLNVSVTGGILLWHMLSGVQ